MVGRILEGARQTLATAAEVTKHVVWYVSYQMGGSAQDVPERSPAARRAGAARVRKDEEEA